MVRITEKDGIELIAEKMNGREYREELSEDGFEEAALRVNGIVVAFGYSDDNVEFTGAVRDEVDSYSGSETLFGTEGIIRNECDEDKCPNFEKLLELVPHGTVTSESDEDGYSHKITADFPHAKFEIREDGEKYCQGIVFRLSDTVTKA